MKKKIVITGGLGYIGTELCKIYSGYSWKDNIIVIDNRFISERVNQLRKWNIEFIHGDILDKKLINKHCNEANTVHHLAGITDVPRTKNESNQFIDEKIKLVAIEGTQNILDSINDNCKLIFPSTHVVYEGIKEVKELPDKSGELRGYSDYYRRQKDMAKPHTLYVKDVIDNGIKKTISGHPDKREFVEKVVLEYGVKETWGYDKQPQIRIDNVIENGIRPTSKM